MPACSPRRLPEPAESLVAQGRAAFDQAFAGVVALALAMLLATALAIRLRARPAAA